MPDEAGQRAHEAEQDGKTNVQCGKQRPDFAHRGAESSAPEDECAGNRK